MMILKNKFFFTYPLKKRGLYDIVTLVSVKPNIETWLLLKYEKNIDEIKKTSPEQITRKFRLLIKKNYSYDKLNLYLDGMRKKM